MVRPVDALYPTKDMAASIEWASALSMIFVGLSLAMSHEPLQLQFALPALYTLEFAFVHAIKQALDEDDLTQSKSKALQAIGVELSAAAVTFFITDLVDAQLAEKILFLAPTVLALLMTILLHWEIVEFSEANE
jgi:hypothetical protein